MQMDIYDLHFSLQIFVKKDGSFSCSDPLETELSEKSSSEKCEHENLYWIPCPLIIRETKDKISHSCQASGLL